MAQEPSSLAATLNYRSAPLHKRHRFVVALIFSLPGLSLWTLLLLAFLGHFYGGALLVLWLAATPCVIGSLVYYDGVTGRRPKPWFVEVCLAINLLTFIICFFMGCCLAIPVTEWLMHLFPVGPL